MSHMSQRKRWISFFVMAAMLLQLSACSGAPSGLVSETGGSPQSEPVSETNEGQPPASEMVISEKDVLPAVGEEIAGFTLEGMDAYAPLAADFLYFKHMQSGAQLCYIKNDDTNRAFAVAYRTPHVDEADTNHVFEHAVIASSDKYPSKNLFFDMLGKTYNTFVNAFTYQPFTIYPVCSQSEEQLMKMADAYLSCMVSPGLLKDERFFKREAVRYMLYDTEDPITMGGTVFSEDMGYMTNITREAIRNIQQGLYPGEYAANCNGQAFVNYQELTYENTKATFDRAYSFDNALLLLYGDLDYRSFLEFLDAEYLSKAENRNTDLSAYDDPQTQPGYVEQVVDAPAYNGDSTEDASIVYYAMDLDGASWETLKQYDIFASMLNNEGSIFHEKLEEAGLNALAYASGYYSGEKPFFIFGMINTNQESAAPFKAVVDAVLEETAEKGIDPELVEAVLKMQEIEDYTIMEDADAAVSDVFPEICAKWAQTGQADIYADYEKAFQVICEDTRQTRIRELASGLKNAGRSALVTTVPKPGLAEEIVAEQEEYLAQMKASMTGGELEQMVADTLAFDEWNASEMTNDDITIPVTALPEPEELPSFEKEEADGITCYTSVSEVDKISRHRIYFDSSSIAQEDLPYLYLYSILLEELTAGNYSIAEKENLKAQYLYGLDFNPVYPDQKAGAYHRPMFSADWYCLAEDYETSLNLLLEIMGSLNFNDKEGLLRVFDRYLSLLDWSRSDPDQLNELIADTSLGTKYQYKEYLTGQRFYEFAKELQEHLDADPDFVETLADKLHSVQEQVLRKDRLIVVNIAPQEEAGQNLAVSKKVLGTLPSLQADSAVYTFSEYPQKTAVIVEGSNYYTYSVSSLSSLANPSGTLFPFINALSNKYVVPQVRFQGLAYSGGMGHNSNLDVIYTYTYSDPRVAESLAVIDQEADALEALELTQEELDGYILNSYSIATYPSGKLEAHMEAVVQDIEGFDRENWKKLASEIKTTMVSDQADAVAALRVLLENQRLATVGNEELIQAESDVFDKVYDYRKPLAQQP